MTLQGGFYDDEEEEGEQENEEDEEEEEEKDIDWSLRKCSAAFLDAAASNCGNEVVFPIIGPYLQILMNSEDEIETEVAVLALGAIYEGWKDKGREFMPTILQFIIKALNKDSRLNMAIAAWTASRYHAEFASCPDLFNVYFSTTLGHLSCPSHRVRIAACSSLSVMFEDPGIMECFSPMQFGQICDAVQAAMNNIKHKETLEGVFDMINTIFDQSGEKFIDQILAFFPTVINIYETKLKRRKFPYVFFEVFSSFFRAAKVKALEFVDEVFGILRNQLEKHFNDQNFEDSKDIAILLDCIDDIFENCGDSCYEAYINNGFSVALCSLIKKGCEGVLLLDDIYWQSMLALLGDIGKCCPSVWASMQPLFREINLFQLLFSKINSMNKAVKNNAFYAFQHLCKHDPIGANLYVPSVINAFENCLIRQVEGTAAVCVAQFCSTYSENEIFNNPETLIKCLEKIPEEEINLSISVMNYCLRRPHLKPVFSAFLSVVNKARALDELTQAELRRVMVAVKNSMPGDSWNEFLNASLPLRQLMYVG